MLVCVVVYEYDGVVLYECEDLDEEDVWSVLGWYVGGDGSVVLF